MTITRRSSQEPLPLRDEVTDEENYQAGKRRGLAEAIDAATFLGYSIGRQRQAQEAEEAEPEHDLELLDVTIEPARALTVLAQALTQVFFCRRCGAVCSEKEAFDYIACSSDDEEDEETVEEESGVATTPVPTQG